MSMLGSLTRSMRPLVERHPRLAMAYRHYCDLEHLARMPVTTPFGFKFIGPEAMQSGVFEPDEVRVVQLILRESDALINVGANVGYYCCFALQSSRAVLAVEPVPNNLRVLYRNLLANGWGDRAEVVPVAVGAQRGLVEIFGGGTAASLVEGWAGIPSAYRQTVPLARLDDIVGERYDDQRCFILIDVEGAELGVLRGASRLLDLGRAPKPIWMVEVAIDEHFPMGIKINPNLRETFEMFERAGYAVGAVGPTLARVSYDAVREIARTGINTLNSHNFVFADAARLDALIAALGATG